MHEDYINDIEENLFRLVGQIEYGEISNIETYWASLTESVDELSHAIHQGSSPISNSLSNAIEKLKPTPKESLIETSRFLENKCKCSGSTDSISYDDIEKIQSDSIYFEKEFIEFIEDLKSKYAYKKY